MDNRQLTWTPVKVFTDPATKLAVEVSSLALRTPKYSLHVGSIRKERDGAERFVRFIAPEVKVENAVATATYRGTVLARLLDEATLFVQERRQKAADEEIERRQYYETRRDAPRQDTKISPLSAGLTPEQRAAKKHRHEANLANRRSSDAELRQKMRGK